MPVQIHITGENAGQAIEELTALAGQFVPRAVDAPVVVAEAPKQRSPRTPKAEPVKPSEPEPETATDAAEDDVDQHLQEADEQPTVEESNEEPFPTDVDLRAAASAAGKRVGADKMRKLLTKYGSANVTAVPADKRVAFLKEMEGLK